MPRNLGSIVDTASCRVRARDGLWYPLDKLVVAGHGLYYARTFEGDPNVTLQERWLLSDQGWSFSRYALTPEATLRLDWYVEPDLIAVKGGLWYVKDGYLDLEVYEGSHYRLDDADELADGLRDGEIGLDEACAVLRSLDRLCDEFRDRGYSGAAVLAAYAPDLPR